MVALAAKVLPFLILLGLILAFMRAWDFGMDYLRVRSKTGMRPDLTYLVPYLLLAILALGIALVWMVIK